MERRVRTALVAAAVAACSLSAGAEVASACSCLPMDPAARLAEGTPAVVGTVVGKEDAGPLGDPPMGSFYHYTLAVERDFNTDLPAEIAIRGHTLGSACGFDWSIGTRVGAFVARDESDDTRWTTSSCAILAPDALIAAADAPPPPPPVQLHVVGGDPDSWIRLRTGLGATKVPGRGRLAARPGARVAIRLDRSASRVRVTLAGRHGKPLGRGRSARSKQDGDRLWALHLPRSIPARAKRLDIAVRYADGGSATFVVALDVQRKRAGAACAAR